jgi:hypothetical protein
MTLLVVNWATVVCVFAGWGKCGGDLCEGLVDADNGDFDASETTTEHPEGRTVLCDLNLFHLLSPLRWRLA